MTTEFSHLLITRFNLKFDFWETSRNGQLVLTEKWLKNRFALFKNYCFPSVKNQTNQQFEWLVFFDTDTPNIYKGVVTELEKEFEKFIPLYVDGMENFLPTIKTTLKNYKSPYVLTTRLDNDDCLGTTFIEEVQKNFERQNFMAIDYPDGYTLQIDPQVRVGKRKQIYAPFMSLIEKNEQPETIWSKAVHSGWKREKNVRQISDKRIWMSVIHSENKKNDFMGFGKVDMATVFDNFKIEPSKKKELLKSENPLKNWRGESLSNRISSNRKVLNKEIKRKLGIYG